MTKEQKRISISSVETSA